MNKFSGPDDPGYRAVAGKIAIILHSIRTNSVLEDADAWIRINHYTDEMLKIERISGETLPMDQCYINLAMVKHVDNASNRSKDRDTAQSSPFSLTARLKIEMPDKKFLIELPKLLDSREGPDGWTKAPRRILIRGRAGVGKTTLCKKIVHDFTYQKMWQGLFKRVLWVPLRSLKGRATSGYNLEKLFYDEYFSQSTEGDAYAKELFREVEKSKGDRTLFILDGLDEVSELDRDMNKFLRDLLRQPNTIITTRPHATFPPHTEKPELELETIGFHPNQVTEYLEKTIRDKQKVDGIQSFFRDHPLIQGLVRIPIQLDAFCYTWDEGYAKESIPETMTAVYEAIQQKLWAKDILRLEKKFGCKTVTENNIRNFAQFDIEHVARAEIRLLEALGFSGIYSDVIDFEPGHRERIVHETPPFDMILPLLSFMRTSGIPSKENQRSYHFLHLTFQEYFAARYFVRQWRAVTPLICIDLHGNKDQNIEPTVFLQTHKYNTRYDIFWRFVTGLLDAKGKAEEFFKAIEDEPRDMLGPTHQRLVMHCLSEVSAGMSLRKSLEESLIKGLLFECSFSRDVFLAREAEFPERALLTALKNGTHHQRLGILNALGCRAHLTMATIDFLEGLLCEKDKNVRSAAADVLMMQSSLPETTVNLLIELLRDEHWDVRSTAAKALANQLRLPQTTINLLIGFLSDEDKNVRSAATAALKNQSIPETYFNLLIGLLSDEDDKVQWGAVQYLFQSSLPESVVNLLIRLLRDENWNVRSMAVEALRTQPSLPETTVNFLVEFLRDDEEYVRFAAAQALEPSLLENINLLIRLLCDEEKNVRTAAARALETQSSLPETTINLLTGLLSNKNKNVRWGAVQYFAFQSSLPETAVSLLDGLLRKEDKNVRSAAAKALTNQSSLPEATVNLLIRLLCDEDVRSIAAKTLGNQSSLPEAAINLLIKLLCDEDSNVRSAATEALTNQSSLPETYVNVLIGGLCNKDEDLRCACANSLGKQSSLPETAINLLIGLLRDEHWEVRSTAAKALANQSRPLEAAVDLLTMLLCDKHEDVRSAAAKALRNQLSLLETTINLLVGLICDWDDDVRSAAAEALANQPSLPGTTINLLMGLLHDENWVVRYTAAEILETQSNKIVESVGFTNPERTATATTTILRALDNELIRTFSQVLLWQSFREQLTLSLRNGSNNGGDQCILYMQGGTKEVSFENRAWYDCFLKIISSTCKPLEISNDRL